MGYCVINFVSEAYTLQYDTTCDGKISTDGELVVNDQYLICMQEKKKCYWDQKQQKQVIIVPTLTIVHPCVDVVVVKYAHNIFRSICNRNQ